MKTSKCIAGMDADANSNIDYIDCWLTIPIMSVAAFSAIGSSFPVVVSAVVIIYR